MLVNHAFRALVPTEYGRDPEPSAAVPDSQTVRSKAHGGKVRYDAGKKTKGRKRFIIVDTLGLLLGVTVVPANVPERIGAQNPLQPLMPALGTLWKQRVDGGHNRPDLAEWARKPSPNPKVELIRRSDDARGFTGLPHRWGASERPAGG